jgi:hypothetical protein
MTSVSKLLLCIARQNSHVSATMVNYLTARVRARVKLGQSEEVALDQVFELYQHAVYLALHDHDGSR